MPPQPPTERKVPAPFSGAGTFFLTTGALRDTMIERSMSIDPLTDDFISWGVFLFLPPPVPPLGGARSINRHLPCVLLIVRRGGRTARWDATLCAATPRREINVSRRGGLTIGQPPRNGLFHAVNNIAKKVPCQSGAKVTAAPSAAVPHAPHFLLRKKNVTRG